MPSVKLVMRREFGQERLKFDDKAIQERWEVLGHRIASREAIAFIRALGVEVTIDDE